MPVQGVDINGDIIKTFTSKRNLKYPLKHKMDDNVKVPGKLPRTYDRSKCVICLEDK